MKRIILKIQNWIKTFDYDTQVISSGIIFIIMFGLFFTLLFGVAGIVEKKSNEQTRIDYFEKQQNDILSSKENYKNN